MIFNSVSFLIFFILFFLLYWSVFNRNVKFQNLLLLLGSYLFYAWADWRFLSILVVISALNFFLGIYIARTTNRTYKNMLYWTGLLTGIGGLAFFKYFNFFVTSINDSFQIFGINLNLHSLHIIIPIGISFFTFRILSYLIDINRGKIKPTTDWVVFFSYVSFFPSLLSGPIDRAKMFIPQLEKKRTFSYEDGKEGMSQIIWGLFKKVVIADNCAVITEPIFNNFQIFSGSSLLFGAFLFTIQIYADFSGYSDMAIGLSRLLGFKITKNFDFPFFAQNIAEFWRKWHISLTSWLTEYLFTPLSITFRDLGKLGLILAIVINFTIIGIWHGANWTFVLFGFLHGCYFIPLVLNGSMTSRKKNVNNGLIPSLTEFIDMAVTFTLVTVTFIIFKMNTVSDAFDCISIILSKSLFSLPRIVTGELNALIITIFIVAMFLIEWLQRGKEYGLQIEHISHPGVRLSIYYALLIVIILFGSTTSNQFIYFKF